MTSPPIRAGYHSRPMVHTRPPGLEGRRVEQLLTKAKAERSTGARMDLLSGLLLDSRYEAHGLVGSADTREVFTASLERFDCVTYVETVLALARASRASQFATWLRRIRYDGSQVDWTGRNHYMTGWIRSNVRVGTVRRIRPGFRVSRKHRLLDAVPGLPPRRTRFACVPKSEMKRLKPRLATGDLIFFASTRSHLDVFHCGILVKGGDSWKMRHAARSREKVVEDDLDGFLAANRMAGVIVVRPTEDPAAD